MDKCSYFKITGLTMQGFICHQDEIRYQFDDLNVITGGNRAGKTTIADAVAMAFTGKGYTGGRSIDPYYHEAGRSFSISVDYVDEHGTPHTLMRQRKNDRMEIALDGSSVRQKDLNAVFGDTDEFLALFNPLYFIENLGDDGRELLEKLLPPVAPEEILSGLNEEHRRILSDYRFLSPEAALKNLRETRRECMESLSQYDGRKSLLSEMTRQREAKKAELEQSLAQLRSEDGALEAKRTAGLNFEAMRGALTEMALRQDEMMNDAPKPFDAAPYRARQEEIRQKIEARRSELYESKFRPEIERLEQPLNLLRVRHRQLSAFLKALEPGRVCPQCCRPISVTDIVECTDSLKRAVEDCCRKGTELKLKQEQLTALDRKSRETFEQFQKDDLRQLMAQSAAVTKECDDALDAATKEQTTHARALAELSARMQTLDLQIVSGNLSEAELARQKEVREAIIAKTAELRMLEDSDDVQRTEQEDKTCELIKRELAETDARITAVLDYAAKRNELLFSKLHTQNVECRLYDVIKSTGEVRNIWSFTYKGRNYRRLSHSEKVLAGLEMTELLKQLTGRCYPVFVDDSESVDNIPRPSGQAFIARVVRGRPLEIRCTPVRQSLAKAG